MQSKEFVDLIEIDTVPPPDIIAKSQAPMIEAIERQEPRFTVTIGDEIRL